MMRRTMSVAVAAAALLGLVSVAYSVFHLVVIDEVVTSLGGDATVQFIEMRMLNQFQNAVQNSVFAAFDTSGFYVADILVVPGNVTASGNGVRWLVGTSQFQTVSGLTPDFIMPAGILPTAGGMVCYGGGGGITPAPPNSWDRNDFANYVDCVAYGTYAGTTNSKIGTPTPLDGDGHSLQRTTNTMNNIADFTCGDPLTPENNAGTTVSLAATVPCGGCPPAPDGGCLGGFSKGTLLVKEAPAGKQKLLVKMIGGPALTQTDLGNPLVMGGTAYDICIYDDAGALVGSLAVDRAGDTCGAAPCWKATGGDPPAGKGYKYKDDALAAAGVFKFLYKSGAVGKSKALIKGKGDSLPDGVSALLQNSTNATVQIHGSDAPQCLSVTVSDIKKHDPDFFKAK